MSFINNKELVGLYSNGNTVIEAYYKGNKFFSINNSNNTVYYGMASTSSAEIDLEDIRTNQIGDGVNLNGCYKGNLSVKTYTLDPSDLSKRVLWMVVPNNYNVTIKDALNNNCTVHNLQFDENTTIYYISSSVGYYRGVHTFIITRLD